VKLYSIGAPAVTVTAVAVVVVVVLGAALIFGVVALTEELEPAVLLAVTSTSSVFPTSAAVTTYVCAVCPNTSVQPPPSELQSRHWNPPLAATNRKTRTLIRTMLEGWAHAAIDSSSHECAGALDGWLWHHNHQ
jgi:hypothetical protein